MGKKLDINTGDKFGRWTVIRELKRSVSASSRKFECLCDCGSTASVQLTHLVQGASKSCGCLRVELSTKKATKHGYSFNRVARVWLDMKRRCFETTHARYSDWGGRGITVCEEWMDVEVFLIWAEQSGYKRGLLLDRINNDGNYEPSNCRWSSMKEQGNNRRNNRLISHNGMVMTLTQWADLIGIHPVTLSSRINSGWGIEKSLTTPLQIQHSRRKQPC